MPPREYRWRAKGWEVDWSKRQGKNQTGNVWARNTRSHMPLSREWHWVTLAVLRSAGIDTPTFRKDSWEIDWSKRSQNSHLVWGRNSDSKMPSARVWHWVDFQTIKRAGLPWKPVREKSGRSVGADGYVHLRRTGMTEEEIQLADRFDLFRGEQKRFVKEHRLVAARKYQRRLDGMVVRHINGIKTDNRPENLVIGTTKENTRDHNKARIAAMYWRQRCQQAESALLAHKIPYQLELLPNF